MYSTSVPVCDLSWHLSTLVELRLSSEYWSSSKDWSVKLWLSPKDWLTSKDWSFWIKLSALHVGFCDIATGRNVWWSGEVLLSLGGYWQRGSNDVGDGRQEWVGEDLGDNYCRFLATTHHCHHEFWLWILGLVVARQWRLEKQIFIKKS